MITTVLFFLGLAVLFAVVYYAINALAPDPIRKWAIVVLVVLVGVAIAAQLMGYNSVGSMGMHHSVN